MLSKKEGLLGAHKLELEVPTVSNQFGPEVKTSLLDARDNSFLIVDFQDEPIHDQWFLKNKHVVLEKLLEHGVIYLRNGHISKDSVVRHVEELVGAEALLDSYAGGVASRPKIDKSLFLTTEAPAGNAIHQHYEMSYMKNSPRKIFFYSNLPAEHGGATPVTFSRRMKKDLDPQIFEEYKKRGIYYIRNYYGDAKESWKLLLTWQKAFEVKTKKEFEAYAKKSNFEFEWTANNGLRTLNLMPGIIRHPETGEEFLHNHSVSFRPYDASNQKELSKRIHFESLALDERAKIESIEPGNQPYAVAWGDNLELISNDIIEQIYQVSNNNKVSLNWRKGDLMIVDNILASHGRDPFKGERETFALLSSK